MPKAEEIKVLNIDGTPYAVDGMSDTVKAMVEVFNEWSQKEVDAQDELAMIRAAKNDLSRQIILQVRQEQEEAEKEDEEAAKAEAGTDENTEGTVNDASEG